MSVFDGKRGSSLADPYVWRYTRVPSRTSATDALGAPVFVSVSLTAASTLAAISAENSCCAELRTATLDSKSSRTPQQAIHLKAAHIRFLFLSVDNLSRQTRASVHPAC